MERRSTKETRLQRSTWLLFFTPAIIVLLFGGMSHAQTSGSTISSRARRQILVSVPDRMLAVIEASKVIRTFPVSVGASVSPSPTGELQIVGRLANPTYYHPGVVIPAGADNPIGPRWIGLSQKGFGIHGTNHPESIGHAASHGCIRLRNRDIKQLFEMVRVGDVVEIRGERDQQTAEIFGGAGDSTTTLADAIRPTLNPIEEGQ
jgi:lipoprotein-anchoring transpeptidase ErfK/SrfK